MSRAEQAVQIGDVTVVDEYRRPTLAELEAEVDAAIAETLAGVARLRARDSLPLRPY